jgi:hypothetical protein
VVAGVREARPDILFLALPSPRKEYFLAHRQKELGCAWWSVSADLSTWWRDSAAGPRGGCSGPASNGSTGWPRSRGVCSCATRWQHPIRSPHRRVLGATVARPQERRVGPTARTGLGRPCRPVGPWSAFSGCCTAAAGSAAGRALTATAIPGLVRAVAASRTRA